MCAACSWPRGTSVTIIASRLVGATIRPRRSSIATPDQFDPRRFPGNTTVPLSDGGVKIGPERSDAIRARHCSCASGVTPNASAAVSPSGTRRNGSAGEGWVGEGAFPPAARGGGGGGSRGEKGGWGGGGGGRKGDTLFGSRGSGGGGRA